MKVSMKVNESDDEGGRKWMKVDESVNEGERK